MISISSRLLGSLLVLGSAAGAQVGTASVNVYYETAPAQNVKLSVRVEGASGPAAAIYLSVGGDEFSFGHSWLLGFAPLNAQGKATLPFAIPEALLDSVDFPMHFAAAYKAGLGGVKVETKSNVLVGAIAPDCTTLDFNHTIGDDSVMVAGRVIAEQWADIGLHISAKNGNGTHPHKAILFDSANPTGGDDDLATPNPMGVGNDIALGNLLIISENDLDANPADGLVDVPDDEAAGGRVIFDFDEPTTLCAVTLVDIDEEPGTQLRFYRNGNLATPDFVIPVITLGDGSAQTVTFSEANVERFEVFFQGSGGVGPIEMIPCPRVIDFDEDTTGHPLNFTTGEVITEQYAFLGVHISGVNNGSAGEPGQNHPNKVILFDSGNPTGNDPDLLTPNPMVPGNDVALGYVLIIAEDDIDVAPADGFVDDPDDEAGGGQLRFAFDYPVTLLSMRVLDVDDDEVDELRFFDEFDALITSIVVPDMPDGSVQLIPVGVSGVRRVVVALGGSGAVTRLRFCPDPVNADS